MTMARLQRHRRAARAASNVLTGILAAGTVLLAGTVPAKGQGPRVHFQHAGLMPPGAIGAFRLRRGGPLSGYTQPVEIRAPEGTRVALALEGGFLQPEPAPQRVGLFVASVYRVRVTHIPGRPGLEVFPTVEVIDRTYPPTGKKWRFPIPVELTRAELIMAGEGKLVTRVIYLEDPQSALPLPQVNGQQEWFEAPLGEDPLAAADRLGRPVAILRMGGRLPDSEGPDEEFLYGSPPFVPAPEIEPSPPEETGEERPEELPPPVEPGLPLPEGVPSAENEPREND